MFSPGVVDLTDHRMPGLPMGARIALLAYADPGPDVITELNDIDVIDLTEHDQVLFLRAWERQRSWLDAKQQPVLAAVGGERGDHDWGREEVAAGLTLSKVAAGRRLDVARDLTHRLHQTLAALRAGRISWAHAAHLAEETSGLPLLAARQVEALCLPRAVGEVTRPGETVATFRRTVARAILTVDAEHAEKNNRNGVEDRDVRTYPTGPGLASITADDLPADKANMVMGVLRARAGKTGTDDQRTLAQRLADAFVDVFDDARARLDQPTQHGRRPVTSLVLDFATWVGLAEHPGYLDGYGWIPAGMARRIADESDLRRLITDPATGHLIDASPRIYRPNQALTDFVVDRDRICSGIGCNRPARTCDLDHAIPFSEGGTTTSDNIGAKCGRDHPLRHEGGWQVQQQPDGTTAWTSPTGHRYLKPPWDYRPLN